MSYTQFLYHIVFRTKRSIPAIFERSERELYAYILGYTRNKKAKLYRIGGMPDHIHMLIDIPPTIAVAEFMRGLKESTSKWLKGNPSFPTFIGWGESYAAFTYSLDSKNVIIEYIKNQKEHHNRISFVEEYRRILVDNGITPNDKYFLID